MNNPYNPQELAEHIAQQLETIEQQGDATVQLSPDYRRMLVSATILARRLADILAGRLGENR